VGDLPLSLWSASLFRSNQTAVESGNGAAWKKLMGKNSKKSGFSLSNLRSLSR
jgi:hypothetical protein